MSDVRLDERPLLSVAEAESYARVSTGVLAGLPVVMADPWSSSGSKRTGPSTGASYGRSVNSPSTGAGTRSPVSGSSQTRPCLGLAARIAST